MNIQKKSYCGKLKLTGKINRSIINRNIVVFITYILSVPIHYDMKNKEGKHGKL